MAPRCVAPQSHFNAGQSGCYLLDCFVSAGWGFSFVMGFWVLVSLWPPLDMARAPMQGTVM